MRQPMMLAVIATICGWFLPLPAAGQVPKSAHEAQLQPRVPGFVSSDAVIRFEDMKTLSPALKSAVGLLRDGRHAEALRAFRALQESDPTDPLPFRGEMHAAYLTDTLQNTIARFRSLLADASGDKRREAVLHYALGSALIASKVGKVPWDDHKALGTEPRDHLQKAVRLWPDLAAKIRFLHARTWDRPGYMAPEELARLKRMGVTWPEDRRMMPEKAITEYKQLIRDFPDYVPAYERIAQDYEWPLGNKEMAQEYRKLAEEAKQRLTLKAGK